MPASNFLLLLVLVIAGFRSSALLFAIYLLYVCFANIYFLLLLCLLLRLLLSAMFIAVVSRISLADRARMRCQKALQRYISVAKRMRTPKGRHGKSVVSSKRQR